MNILGVLCMVGLTVALPVLPDPPKLPFSTATTHQNQKFHTNTPKKDTASPPVRYNIKEVKKDIVKTYKVSIPPPPELPPFDYSTLINQKPQKAIEKPVKVVKEFKPIENYKFQEVQPNKEYQFLGEPKSVEEPKPAVGLIQIEEPTNVEEPKSAEELILKEEPTNVEGPKSAEELIPIEEVTIVEKPQPIEEPIKESTYVEEPKSVEDPKPIEEPIKESTYVDIPKSVEEFIPIEELTIVEEPQPIEEPIKESIYVEEHKSVEEPNTLEEPKTAEEPKSVEEPKTAEEPKAVEHLDSSKLEPKEDPEKLLEDIPVLIQFTIPITTFFSSIFSKLPSLSTLGLSWPFHKPSLFGRPRVTIANDEIYPY